MERRRGKVRGEGAWRRKREGVGESERKVKRGRNGGATELLVGVAEPNKNASQQTAIISRPGRAD